jgi:hypothetical protein
MSRLTGMWISKFDDAEDSAQDGQVIAEINSDYLLVTLRNVVAGPPASSQLFKISDLANDSTLFFPDEEAMNAWHAFIQAGIANVVPFDKGGR